MKVPLHFVCIATDPTHAERGLRAGVTLSGSSRELESASQENDLIKGTDEIRSGIQRRRIHLYPSVSIIIDTLV